MFKELSTAPFTTPSAVSIELALLERELDPYWNACASFTPTEMDEYFGHQPFYQEAVRNNIRFNLLCDANIHAEHRVERAIYYDLPFTDNIPF